METKSSIWGHIVVHDESVRQGMRYLTSEIDAHEAKVFFDQAFSHGFASFEDKMGYNYKLVHHGSEYQLVKA